MLKRFFFGTSLVSSAASDAVLAAARVYIGLSMAFAHGYGKIPPAEQFVAGVEEMGFPMPIVFAWSASLAEFLGGLLLAAGLFTRPAALSIASTMVVAGFVRHAADPFKVKELAFLFLATSLAYFALGGGRFSVDRLFRDAKSAKPSKPSKPSKPTKK